VARGQGRRNPNRSSLRSLGVGNCRALVELRQAEGSNDMGAACDAVGSRRASSLRRRAAHGQPIRDELLEDHRIWPRTTPFSPAEERAFLMSGDDLRCRYSSRVWRHCLVALEPERLEGGCLGEIRLTDPVVGKRELAETTAIRTTLGDGSCNDAGHVVGIGRHSFPRECEPTAGVVARRMALLVRRVTAPAAAQQ